MKSVPRHLCMIYDGDPAKSLPCIATLILGKLAQNFRCLYLNSPQMVEGIHPQLAAAGVDVSEEIRRGSLVLTSSQSHLVDGHFDPASMITMLTGAVRRALSEGYRGLFATGDMTWEFGPDQDFDTLLEYENALEDVFERLPHLSGVCQYHQGTLPVEALRKGLHTHRGLYVNETLRRINPYYKDPELLTRIQLTVSMKQVKERLDQLCAV
ncbi:MAG TPA: MEDS domain-containing protein [Bryobacteraceae bacterium]|nr:MEDS domain-containing protein [Bryobacteraceae bacterium]